MDLKQIVRLDKECLIKVRMRNRVGMQNNFISEDEDGNAAAS